MLNQLTCLNLLIPPADPKRESPLRGVYRAAADLMVKAISAKLRDDEYEACVTGLVSTGLLKGRPLPANLRLTLGQLLALHPSDRAKAADRAPTGKEEDGDQRSDVFLIHQLIESLTAVIAAHEASHLDASCAHSVISHRKRIGCEGYRARKVKSASKSSAYSSL